VFNAALSMFEERRADTAVEFLNQRLSIQAMVKPAGLFGKRVAVINHLAL